MKNPFNTTPDTEVDENTWKMRAANRRYMAKQAKRVAKWTLMTAGAVAIVNAVTTKNDIEEDES